MGPGRQAALQMGGEGFQGFSVLFCSSMYSLCPPLGQLLT